MGHKVTYRDYSALADTVLMRKRSKGEQVFLVASPGSREGKTTTAINLAKALARSDQQTLLIDLDFEKPEIGAVLGVSAQEPPETTEHPQPVQHEDNLWVLPAISESPEKLKRIFLGSDKGEELIRIFRNEFDVLIIDSSSRQNNLYVECLAGLCDGIIIVAQAYHTTAEEVATLSRKVTSGAVVGVVLNNRKEYVPRILRKLFLGSE
ncbi:MAG: CpsD/CapB family tyrosine-protein kinase [Candidatus Abyssubacteria bacterium]